MLITQLANRPTPERSLISYNELGQGPRYMMNPHSDMSYQHGLQTFSDGSYAPSLGATSYSSPQPSHVILDDWQRPYIHIGENEVGVWRRYVTSNGLEEPTLWPYRSSDYQQRPNLQSQHNYPNPQLYGRSPLTLSTDHESLHVIPRDTPELDSNPASSTTTPSSKRKRAVKSKEKTKRAALEKPLSELTKEITNIPIKDTEAWVNRSLEERLSEKRADGSIKRPSNSFMLYRSAYTERCRELEKSKNHQDISSIAGSSWAIETPEIKTQFEEWAKTERENHHKAFPDYKFQPQTQAAKERKRKRKSDETSEEASDPEDLTYYNGRAGASQRRSARTKNARTSYREYSDSPTLTSQDEANTPEPYILSQNTSYFGNVVTGKPLPQAIGQTGGYFVTSQPQSVYGTYSYPGGEQDMNYFHSDPPSTAYGSLSPPVGLPGGSHSDLMGDLPMDGGHLMLGSSSLLDPELENHEQSGMATLLPPGSARSGGFHANDYLRDGDGAPYLTQFDQDEGL